MFRSLRINIDMFLAALYAGLDNQKKVFEKTMHAANLGDSKAQNKLGVYYSLGNGVEKDLVEAASWYKKSANNGDMYAQANIGLAYYYGHGVTQSYKMASEWYKKAAKQGHKESQYNLGLLYADDLEKEDIEQAVLWLSMAESNGIKEASIALDRIKQSRNQ